MFDDLIWSPVPSLPSIWGKVHAHRMLGNRFIQCCICPGPVAASLVATAVQSWTSPPSYYLTVYRCLHTRVWAHSRVLLRRTSSPLGITSI